MQLNFSVLPEARLLPWTVLLFVACRIAGISQVTVKLKTRSLVDEVS